eukprot:XP_011670941.1 PREDICTED: uncharacterized protein LOC105441500 [Strongylocentrotus purpuratus]
MEEVVLSDDLVVALSEQINITLYPVSHFAVDLGFDSAAASVAEELAIQKQHPHGKYEYLLHKFVATHGRGAKAAQVLIDRFNVNRKMLLVNFLEEAIETQNALKQSGRRQEPGHAEGQGQTGTEISPLNVVAGLSLIVVFLAIVAACTWNNLSTEPGKCASSPCQNGGTCHPSEKPVVYFIIMNFTKSSSLNTNGFQIGSCYSIFI